MATSNAYDSPPPAYPEASAPLMPQGTYGQPETVAYGQMPMQSSVGVGMYQPVPTEKQTSAFQGYPVSGAYQPTVMAVPGQGPYLSYPAASNTSNVGGPGQTQVVVMGQPGVAGPNVLYINAPTPVDSRVHSVNDLLYLSIFTTICCNLLFGIIAIVYSVRIRDAKRCNDYEGAKSAYRVMLAMNITGIILSIAVFVIIVIINVTTALSMRNSYYG